MYYDMIRKNSRTMDKNGFKHTAGNLELVNFSLLAFYLYVNTFFLSFNGASQKQHQKLPFMGFSKI